MLDAGELLTGLDFDLGGLTPTLTSKTGIARTVAGSGSFTDTGSVQDISWQLVSLSGGNYQLNFNPNAKNAILAPPSIATYTANSSINGNPGHNPFVAVTGTFLLNVPGMTNATNVLVRTFRFGTSLQPGQAVPEPAFIISAMMAVLTFACQRRLPRNSQRGCK
jgi:hypothetical protein